MLKKIALILALSLSLSADVIEIKNFESDLFSKEKKGLTKVKVSLLFDGRYLQENRHKVVDALHVIVSSFYVEDLFTSKGKERFKTVLKQYITKKYGIDIDDIFFQKMYVVESATVQEIIEGLKKEGLGITTIPKDDKTISDSFKDIEIDN